MSMTYTDDHIGKRVIYTGRNGNSRFGKIKEITGVASSQYLNLKLEGSQREHFYVPSDTCVLVDEDGSPLPPVR